MTAGGGRRLWAVALGAAPWLFAVRGPVHYDDAVTPMSDPASQSLAAWGAHLVRTLRPLAKLTFAVESSAGLGDLPWVRRLVSVAILAVAAWLLARLMARLGARAEVAVALAWVWAAHPIQAECVLALAGRPMLLATAFVFAALHAAGSGRPRRAALLLLLAILSRETAIAAALPMAVALVPRRGPAAPALRRLAVLELPAAGTVTAVAWLLVQPRYAELADYSMHGRPWAPSVVAQVAAVPLGQTLYARPWALTLDHGEALPSTPDAPLFWVGAALLVAAAAAVVVAWRARHRAVAVGAALWLAALLPTQSVVPKLDPLTERPLPLALAALALCACGVPALRRALARQSPAHAVRRRAVVFGATVVAIVAAVATYERGTLYASEEALWRDAARKSHVNGRPYYNLAKVLEEQGRTAEALDAARTAARLAPFDSHAAALVEVLRLRVPSEP